MPPDPPLHGETSPSGALPAIGGIAVPDALAARSSTPVVLVLGASPTTVHALANALRLRVRASATHVLCCIVGHDRPAPEVASLSGPSPWAEPVGSVAVATATARTATVTLLVGLDDKDESVQNRTELEHIDARLRAALTAADVSYHVVYGHDAQRATQALVAIRNIAISADSTMGTEAFDTSGSIGQARLRAWNCEKCSDPVCEHRLFTRLAGLTATTTNTAP